MKKRMTTQEIVKNSDEVKKSGKDWKEVYAIVYQSLSTNKYRMMRNGNTLFWFRIDEPGVAQMYVFNADSYKHLFRNLKDFVKAMEISKYKKLYGETADINLINLIKRVGYPVDVEKVGKDSKGQTIYRGTLNYEETKNV